jgi:hypothetical protein
VINFRYHVVSLTAVFLALAIGLVLGTAALNGPVADNLNNQVSSLNKRNGQLREEAKQLQNQVDSQADFVVEAAPMLLSGRLTGRSVLVVTTDNADDKHRDAVVQALKQAGATLTGQLRLDDVFIDPKQDEALQDLATRLVPAGVSNLPNNGVGVETSSALLATALVSGGPVVSDASRTSIVSGFSRLGAVTAEGTITKAADAVVVVAGQAATEADADKRNEAQLVILRQFDRVAKYMVLAGPQASGTGSPIASIRGDDTLSNQVSTVDNVSSPEGQVVVPLALAQQLRGKTDHYGSGDGASGRVPDLLKK